MHKVAPRAKYLYFTRLTALSVVFAVSGIAFMLPRTADASIFSYLSEKFSADHSLTSKAPESRNSQTIPLLEASIVPDIKGSARGGGDIVILDENALLPDVGPSGTMADIESNDQGGKISLYVVRKGDTLAQIAKMYGVDTNTIVWANDLDPKATLTSGQTLIILPINGVQHVVKKGDTIESIARKYGGNTEEIRRFNDLNTDHTLSIGDTITIPDGKEVAQPAKSIAKSTKAGNKLVSYAGYYANPLPSGHKTQGIHGYNGIDMGAPVGSTILAAADGRVLVSNFRTAGNPWFGGYGNYVVIEHSNGTQTLYAHMSAVYVSVGARVEQGQPIGEVGNTGHSTGPHLHFEVRGAKNPF